MLPTEAEKMHCLDQVAPGTFQKCQFSAPTQHPQNWKLWVLGPEIWTQFWQTLQMILMQVNIWESQHEALISWSCMEGNLHCSWKYPHRPGVGSLQITWLQVLLLGLQLFMFVFFFMRTNLGLKDLFPKLHLGKILRKKSIANYSLFDFPSSLPSGK